MNNFVHNLNPFAIQFGGAFDLGPLHIEGIRWYGLAYLGGFIAGYLLIRLMSRRGTTPMPEGEVADFITMVAIGTMVGGRLGYCFFYSPSLLTEFSSSAPYWGVLKVYEGGMASHGGIMGIITVCILWARSRKLNPLHLLDLVVFGGTLGVFFGRIANFINGELYGREALGVSWAVRFPQEMYAWSRDSLSKFLDIGPAVQALGQVQTRHGETIVVTADQWKVWVQGYKSDANSWNMVNMIVDRLIDAIQHGNMAVTEAIAPFLTPRYPSQLIQAVLEGLLVFIVLSLIWLKPRKAGVVSALFGVFYAVARIIGEQFRMPDAHIGFQLFGLTRGQWLSLAMLAGMLIYLYISQKRPGLPTGGWGLKSAKSDKGPVQKSR